MSRTQMPADRLLSVESAVRPDRYGKLRERGVNLPTVFESNDESTMADRSITLNEFMQDSPPGELRVIEPREASGYNHQYPWSVQLPEISRHCDSPKCDREMIHAPESGGNKASFLSDLGSSILIYRCRHCEASVIQIAALFVRDREKRELLAYKFGEFPAFGPKTPNRVLRLIESEKEHFLKGRRAEFQGLGIAAFAYYRRVVENRKDAIIDRIVAVARTMGASGTLIQELEDAKAEIKFSAAVGRIKSAIPDSLLIGGQNPLTLLHRALSEGIHELSDADCLDRAQAIRVVLINFVDRADAALKDDAELKGAVSRLMNPKTTR